MNAVIMAGALDTFDLPSVLQAVSLSRQHTSIRLWGSAKQDTGELRVKAGQLLHAAVGPLRGRAAFNAIVRGSSHQTFRVERLPLANNHPEPIGPLARLLLEVPAVTEELNVAAVTFLRSTPPPPPPRRLDVYPAAPKAVSVDANELAQIVADYESIHCVAIHDPKHGSIGTWLRNPGAANLLRHAQRLESLFGETALERDSFVECLAQFAWGVAIMVPIHPCLATYVFAPETPLGVVRLTSSLVTPKLATLLAIKPVVNDAANG